MTEPSERPDERHALGRHHAQLLGLGGEVARGAEVVDGLGELLLLVGQRAGLPLQVLQLVDPDARAVFIISRATSPAARRTMQSTANPAAGPADGGGRPAAARAGRGAVPRLRPASAARAGDAAVLSWLWLIPDVPGHVPVTGASARRPGPGRRGPRVLGDLRRARLLSAAGQQPQVCGVLRRSTGSPAGVLERAPPVRARLVILSSSEW